MEPLLESMVELMDILSLVCGCSDAFLWRQAMFFCINICLFLKLHVNIESRLESWVRLTGILRFSVCCRALETRRSGEPPLTDQFCIWNKGCLDAWCKFHEALDARTF